MRKRTTQRRVRLLKSYFDGGGLGDLAHLLRRETPPTADTDPATGRATPRDEVGDRSQGWPAGGRPG